MRHSSLVGCDFVETQFPFFRPHSDSFKKLYIDSMYAPLVECDKKMLKKLVVGLVTLGLQGVPSGAENLNDSFSVPAIDLNAPAIEQVGSYTNRIKENLKKITLPPGFEISLYAIVPGARHMTVGPSTNRLFVGTWNKHVWSVTHHQKGDMTAEVRAFAPSLEFRIPNGVCFHQNGDLILVEHNRVLKFSSAESVNQDSIVTVTEIVPRGQLIPPVHESNGHGARTCRVGKDNKLYITLGQPYNVQPANKIEEFKQLGIGGIIRMNLDGSHREVYATGLRNSVGQDFNPKDGTLWFTDNQTDHLGNDNPPGELNRITKPGQDFGYPYWGGRFKVAGTHVALDLQNLQEPQNAVFPEIEFPAHQAQLGMIFYTGKMFPPKYRNGIFVASRGSWNRNPPSGALINFVPIKANGRAGKSEVFAEGWLNKDTGNYMGRPVDVAVLKDGSLLVSDDYVGAIYRITYSKSLVFK